MNEYSRDLLKEAASRFCYDDRLVDFVRSSVCVSATEVYVFSASRRYSLDAYLNKTNSLIFGTGNPFQQGKTIALVQNALQKSFPEGAKVAGLEWIEGQLVSSGIYSDESYKVNVVARRGFVDNFESVWSSPYAAAVFLGEGIFDSIHGVIFEASDGEALIVIS